MAFVGPFVGRESRVAVDAVGAVFCGQSVYRIVKFCDSCNQFFGKGIELFLGGEIFAFVGLKPFPVVVLFQTGKKVDYFFHISVVVISMSNPAGPDLNL